jgi:hydroxymethylpyrimidine pyrophosphatase-like HAD family hydrolase
MGKPFNQELKKIEETYFWANEVHVTPLLKTFRESIVWIVGSGGSSSACELVALFQFYSGGIGIPTTPLEIQYKKNAITNRSVGLFISASGRNSDILLAFDTFIQKDPEKTINLCFKTDSPLKEKTINYSVAETLELEIPSGKDGFLATNSLVAYFTIIPRLYGINQARFNILPKNSFLDEVGRFSKSLPEYFTIIVLYAGWGKPVAVDLESKFSEAGLGNILLTDYRNFGHGRHNWFDKKKKQSAIIALITPEEEELAKKTIALLPCDIPVLFVETKEKMANASLDLLVQSFFIVEEFGRICGIDPGRPGVPDYGSKLYKLKYSKLYQERGKVLSSKEAIAISRKIGNLTSLDKDQITAWRQYYFQQRTKLMKTHFSGIVLDYDGTLCSSEERYCGPRLEIQVKLNNFLRHGLTIAVVTGRGKSVRTDLQKFIEKQYWPNVALGYYNGSQIGLLCDDSLPVKVPENDDVLKEIQEFLKHEMFLSKTIKAELRRGQLTIEVSENLDVEKEKRILGDIIRNRYPFEIRVLESSHSIDIIMNSTSKTSIIKYCRDLLDDLDGRLNFLCIGDRGKWPGNDYQLLSMPHSLSVDQVSSDPHSCWNFASTGNRCVEATLEYFDAINIGNGFFTIKI